MSLSHRQAYNSTSATVRMNTILPSQYSSKIEPRAYSSHNFDSRQYISNVVYRFESKVDRRSDTLLTNDGQLLDRSICLFNEPSIEILTSLRVNTVPYNTGLKVCLADIFDNDLLHQAFQRRTKLSEDLKKTLIWPDLVKMMSIPLYRDMSESTLSSWRHHKSMFDVRNNTKIKILSADRVQFLCLLISDATAQFLGLGSLAALSLYEGGGAHAQDLMGDMKSITSALSCYTVQAILRFRGFKESHHFWSWMSQRDPKSLSILGDKAWLFGKMESAYTRRRNQTDTLFRWPCRRNLTLITSTQRFATCSSVLSLSCLRYIHSAVMFCDSN